MMPSCTGLAGRTPSPGVSAVATGVGDDRFATSLIQTGRRTYRSATSSTWEEFAPDSPLEGAGFEPSAFQPDSSVSADLASSVAANLHPYNAQFCTPASTESCYLNLCVRDDLWC